jgi:hypothetical protein
MFRFLNKSFSAFENLSEYKIPWLRWTGSSLHPPQKFERLPSWNNLSYKILQRHNVRAEFHKNIPIGSQVIIGRWQTA